MSQQRMRVCRGAAHAMMVAGVLILAGCTTGSAGPADTGTPSAAGGPTTEEDGSGATSSSGSPSEDTVPSTEAAPTTAAPSTVAPDPQREVTLAVVGDVMLERSVGERILSDGPEAPLAEVLPLLTDADLTVGTLETSIGTGGEPEPKTYTFQAPPESVQTLLDGGFDLVALANNHILDYGPEGLAETVDLLDEAGIAHAGAGADEAAARTPVVLEEGGLSLGFLSYVDVTDESGGYPMGGWAAGDDSPGVAWAEPDQVASDVAALDEDVDHVVVLLHSGTEGSDEVNDTQRAVAAAALEGGATLVLGSHPHVLQAIEEQDGRLVAWSLGNFVFDGFDGYYGDRGVESVVLQLTLDADGVTEWDAAPVRLVDGYPQPLDPEGAGADVLQRLADLPAPGIWDR